MKKKDYIPGPLDQFNEFQLYLVAMVVTNAVAWNILPVLVTAIETARDQFALVYAPITNKQTRTRSQLDAFYEFKATYTTQLRQLVQGSLVNNPLIPTNVKLEMGLNVRSGARTERPFINVMPASELLAVGGGKVKYIFRTNTNSGRVGRLPESDGVEYAYRFEYPNGSKPTPVPPPDPGADPAPGPDPEVASGTESIVLDGISYELAFSSRAGFIKQSNKAGMRIFVRAHWMNNASPEKSGPWSVETSLIIS